jgi:regulatory protein
MAARPASLKVRALQWLAQREHSPLELRGKLLRLLLDPQLPPRRNNGGEAGYTTDGVPVRAPGGAVGPVAEPAAKPDPEAAAAEVDELLAWLGQHGYLSQQRFVESRVQARQARFGNLRIQHELKQHGAALDDDARQALQDSELERAREVWHKKYGRTGDVPADAAARVRQMRFLTGRGFSPAVVRQVIAQTTRPQPPAVDAGPPAMLRRHSPER